VPGQVRDGRKREREREKKMSEKKPTTTIKRGKGRK